MACGDHQPPSWGGKPAAPRSGIARWLICVTSSECGRACPMLVVNGKLAARCHGMPDENLYDLIKDPMVDCPHGRWAKVKAGP